MATAVIHEDVLNTIAIGQTVYDRDGKKIGNVDLVDRETGYFTIVTMPFSEQTLNVPFRLITNIDPREIYLSATREQVHRDYPDPPLSSTRVEFEGGVRVAVTTVEDGYTGKPVETERVKIDQLTKDIEVGDRVFTLDMADLGVIKEYDRTTGWMLIEQGVLWNKHLLMLPVALVDGVSREGMEVFLVASQADLQRMQHLEPAYIVFPEHGTDPSPSGRPR